MKHLVIAAIFVTYVVPMGCSSSVEPPVADIVEGPKNLRIGEACESTKECDYNLLCLEGECAMVDDKPLNHPCVSNGECQPGLFCSLAGICAEAGEGQQGDPCSTGAECDKTHYCRSLGGSGYCSPAGSGDIGAGCSDDGDCLAGLSCNSSGECDRANLNFGLTPWAGVGATACQDDGDGEPIRFHYEIPRTDVTEFFRLPYPNDVRIRNGRVSLEGFPLPGPGLLDFDPVARIVDAIEADTAPGFSLIPTVFFRFSAGIQFSSIEASGESANLHFVNIDPDSGGYKAGQSYRWSATDGGTKYVCRRYLTVEASSRAPLAPNTTYAVFMTTGIQDKNGKLMGPDVDLSLMLSNARPSDAVEAAAWDAMQPLRDYLAEEDTPSADSIIGATLFTTRDVSSTLQQLRQAVQDAPQATVSDLTLCDGATNSPCDDGSDSARACPAEPTAGIDEVHMKVSMPVVQTGTRPYLDSGGQLATGTDGLPALNGTEDVCVSLSIPKTAAMPPNGWPLMLYGHGTGGNFRSGVKDVGAVLSSVTTSDDPSDPVEVGVAVAGWDGVMHGPRRGATDIDPGTLYFNFSNPEAARGNGFQGATDVFALTRLFKDLVIAAADSPTGSEIRFDAGHIGLTGHSQGSTSGPLAAPYEPDLGLTVWSGAGAALSVSLANKRSPVDVASGLSIALSEINDQGLIPVSESHPVVRLVQQYFDPIDPLHHARYAFRNILEDQKAKHTLLVYGVGDSFTPNETTEIFASALGVDHVTSDTSDSFGPTQVPPPVSGNKAAGAITGGVVVHAPDGYDGHFVLFQNPSAIVQYQQFVATWLARGTPVIVNP